MVSTTHPPHGLDTLGNFTLYTGPPYTVQHNSTSSPTIDVNEFLGDMITSVTADFLSTESPEVQPSSHPLHSEIAIKINFYIIFTLVVVGLVCNLLSFSVFLNSPTLRRTTTGHYLIALTVADTGYLIGELLKVISRYDIDGLYYIPMSCQGSRALCFSTYVIRYTFKFMSSWLTVIITVERFLTVRFPLRIALISTPFIARMSIGVVMISSLALNLYPIWTIDSFKHPNGFSYCIVSNGVTYNAWNTAILRISQLLVPCFLILVFTILIIYYVTKAGRLRNQHTQGNQNSRKSMERQLTAMLLAVAVTTLVLRIPYALSYYLNAYRHRVIANVATVQVFDKLYPEITYRLNISEKVTDIFAVGNYVLNFFLYCLCGSTFRGNLVAMFRRILGKKQLNRSGIYTRQSRDKPGGFSETSRDISTSRTSVITQM